MFAATFARFSGTAHKRPVRTVMQSENMECGLACLVMVANAYRHDLDLPYLRALFPPSRRGMTFAEIVEVAGQIGLDAQGLGVSNIGELAKVNCPAILHWNGNHFVVLEKVVRGAFHVHDPAFGPRIYAREDMERHFGGVPSNSSGASISRRSRPSASRCSGASTAPAAASSTRSG